MGVKNWSLTMQAFENKFIRTIYGPKKDKVTDELRKLHNVKFSS
jgi:hypothetical protein